MLHNESAVRHPRFQAVVPVLYGLAVGGGPRSGCTYDISLSGAALDLPEHVPIRTWMSLQMLLGPQALPLHAGVLWCRRPVTAIAVFRHGVIFSPLDENVSTLLSRYLREETSFATRIPFPRTITAVVQASIDALVADLSPLGACLEHRGQLRPDTECHLVLVSPDTSINLAAWIIRSHVVRVDRSPAGEADIVYHTGLRFARVTAGQEQELGALIAHCRREAHVRRS